MDQRADYLIQILDKIGGPLIAALSRVQSEETGAEQTKSEAQTIAELLSRSVQMSIEIGKIMDLNMADPAQSDKFRLALMSLAGPMVAGQFTHDKKVPGDPEQKKIMTALEALLTFSDNFTANQDNADQLKSLEEQTAPANDGEKALYSMRHFAPVVNAVAAFPFGQPEKKLVQEISVKITEKAEMLARLAIGGDSIDPKVELALIKTLAELYTECHNAEMERMLKTESDGGLENVWSAFEIRAAMLETLVQNLLPGSASGSGGGSVHPSAPEQPADELPPITEQSVAPPPAEDSAPPAGANPMSMFAKNPDSAEAPAAPPPPPSTPETPVESPPAPPAESSDSGSGAQNPMSMFAKKPDAGAPPAEPPAAPAAPTETPPVPEEPSVPPATEDSSSDSGGDGQGGSPMSFFKKGDE